MFVYVCCGSILNSVSCLLVASRVLLDSVVTSYAKLFLRNVGSLNCFVLRSNLMFVRSR